MHRLFIHCFVCCCYSWGTPLAQYTHAHAIVLTTKPPNGKKQTESACLSSGNCEMNEFRCTDTTWALSKTYTHVSSSIELACCRLTASGACVCLEFFPRLLYILLWRLLLACFHFSSSSLFNGSSMVFYIFRNIAVSLFLFVSVSRFHFLFAICFEPFSCSCSVYTFCGIFFIISFALPVLVLLRLRLLLLLFIIMPNPFSMIASISFRKHISVVVSSRLISSHAVFQANDASICRCINYFFEMFAVTVVDIVVDFISSSNSFYSHCSNRLPLCIDPILCFQTIHILTSRYDAIHRKFHTINKPSKMWEQQQTAAKR